MFQGKSNNTVEPAAGAAIGGQDNPGSRLRELYRLHQDELRNYIRSRFGRETLDAEDIVQAAFIRYAEQVEANSINNPRAFLFVTARNLAVDELRKANIRLAHRQTARHGDGCEKSDDLTPENVISNRQKCELLYESMDKLPEIQRTVLLMHRIDRLPYSQIARMTGLTESKIRSHIAKAMHRIVKDLNRAGRF